MQITIDKDGWIKEAIGIYYPNRSWGPFTKPVREIVIHSTASPGATAQDIATGWHNVVADASAHILINKDGSFVQGLSLNWTAWGNCCLTDNPNNGKKWDRRLLPGNQNKWSISIEHCKDDPNYNSDILTAAQQATSFALCNAICEYHNIPKQVIGYGDITNGGIIGHCHIDALNRTYCPGPYPWLELHNFLTIEVQPMVKLSSTGEIADFAQADQFPIGESQFECGYFACLMAASIAPVGKPPTLTAQQIIDQSEAWYAKDHGSSLISNMDGMSVQQEYDLLAHLGLHYQALPLDMAAIKAWLQAGYPVIVAIAETSVLDLDLGRNPYPWTPAGNHVILLTGVAQSYSVLVRDSANCTNLYDPGSLRAGPRRYDASKLALVSATVVVPTWMPRPRGQTLKEGFIMPVPQGWTDDKTKLTSPNKHYAVGGIRQHILDAPGWDPNDVLLEEEQQVAQVELHNSNNPGARQLTRNRLLVYTKANGVAESACGLEIQECYKRIAALQAQIAAMQPDAAAKQVADLTSKLAQIAVIAKP